MLRPNPKDLADRQLERDRAATAQFPGLLERKLARMAVSPLAYLRGAAPLFYELLSEYPEFWEGPDGEGWLCGDAHLENFGVYRTEREDGKSRHGEPNQDDSVVFDVNDFDETLVGPFRVDVLRLITSVILGGRELGADGQRNVALSMLLLDVYAATCSSDRPAPEPPAPVRKLLENVEHRSHRDLLDRRTEIVKGVRKFSLGDRYRALPADIERGARLAFERYAGDLQDAGFQKDRFEVLDVAFRVAGTGSLGKLRVAVLTRGKGGPDGAWIFDMKEEGAASAEELLGSPLVARAARVLNGARACLARPPRMMGTTEFGETSLFVRRLAPQEDKLDLSRLKAEDLGALAAYLGALLGRAHRRGATKAPSRAWTTAEQHALVDQAIHIAGIHEATYLALCKARGVPSDNPGAET